MQVLSKFDPALDSVYGGGSTETTTTTNTNTCNGPTKTISINFGPVGIAYTNCKAPAAPSTPASGGENNPFFRSQPPAPTPPAAAPYTPAPPKSPGPPAVKTSYHTAPGNSEDEWDDIEEKEEGDSSEDELRLAKQRGRYEEDDVVPAASVVTVPTDTGADPGGVFPLRGCHG